KHNRDQSAHAGLDDVAGIDELYEARASIRDLQRSRRLGFHATAAPTAASGQWSIDIGTFLLPATVASTKAILHSPDRNYGPAAALDRFAKNLLHARRAGEPLRQGLKNFLYLIHDDLNSNVGDTASVQRRLKI